MMPSSRAKAGQLSNRHGEALRLPRGRAADPQQGILSRPAGDAALIQLAKGEFNNPATDKTDDRVAGKAVDVLSVQSVFRRLANISPGSFAGMRGVWAAVTAPQICFGMVDPSNEEQQVRPLSTKNRPNGAVGRRNPSPVSPLIRQQCCLPAAGPARHRPREPGNC